MKLFTSAALALALVVPAVAGATSPDKAETGKPADKAAVAAQPSGGGHDKKATPAEHKQDKKAAEQKKQETPKQ